MTADFQLIESLLWTPGEGYFLLDSHLERLATSARHFGFQLDMDAVREALSENAAALSHRSKVRLLLYEDGNISLGSASIPDPGHGDEYRVALATEQVNSSNDFLYHKTTKRELYNRLLDECSARGYYDVIFENERSELTEGARNNVVLELAGKLYTPPLKCGLLNGVYRRNMIAAGDLDERILTVKDISEAEKIYCCNSVRGLVEVKYEKP